MKKLLTLLLSVLMVITMGSVNVFAENYSVPSDLAKDNVDYDGNNKTLFEIPSASSFNIQGGDNGYKYNVYYSLKTEKFNAKGETSNDLTYTDDFIRVGEGAKIEKSDAGKYTVTFAFVKTPSDKNAPISFSANTALNATVDTNTNSTLVHMESKDVTIKQIAPVVIKEHHKKSGNCTVANSCYTGGDIPLVDVTNKDNATLTYAVNPSDPTNPNYTSHTNNIATAINAGYYTVYWKAEAPAASKYSNVASNYCYGENYTMTGEVTSYIHPNPLSIVVTDSTTTSGISFDSNYVSTFEYDGKEHAISVKFSSRCGKSLVSGLSFPDPVVTFENNQASTTQTNNKIKNVKTTNDGKYHFVVAKLSENDSKNFEFNSDLNFYFKVTPKTLTYYLYDSINSPASTNPSTSQTALTSNGIVYDGKAHFTNIAVEGAADGENVFIESVNTINTNGNNLNVTTAGWTVTNKTPVVSGTNDKTINYTIKPANSQSEPVKLGDFNSVNNTFTIVERPLTINWNDVKETTDYNGLNQKGTPIVSNTVGADTAAISYENEGVYKNVGSYLTSIALPSINYKWDTGVNTRTTTITPVDLEEKEATINKIVYKNTTGAKVNASAKGVDGVEVDSSDITFKIKDENVALVDSNTGVITPKNVGETYITVTYKLANHNYGDKEILLKVLAVPAPAPAPSQPEAAPAETPVTPVAPVTPKAPYKAVVNTSAK